MGARTVLATLSALGAILAAAHALRADSQPGVSSAFDRFRAYPRFAEAYRQIGLGNADAARRRLREGLAIAPDTPHARASLAALDHAPGLAPRTPPVLLARATPADAARRSHALQPAGPATAGPAWRGPALRAVGAVGQTRPAPVPAPSAGAVLPGSEPAPALAAMALPVLPVALAPVGPAPAWPAAWTVAARGYAAKTAGGYAEARAAFAMARLLPDATPAQQTLLDRELRWIDRRWSADSYSVLRTRSPGSARLAASAGQLGASQAGTSAAVRLNGDPAAPLSATARLTLALDDASFAPDRRSTQGALGLRWKPLRGVNAVVGAERLFAIGGEARDAFAARAAFSAGDALNAAGWRGSQTVWSLYAEGAVVGFRRGDLAASAEAALGQVFPVSQTLSLTPRLIAAAHWQHADRSAGLIEGGPGIALRLAPATWGDTALVARLDYRVRIGGSAASADGLVATFALGF